MYPRTEKLTYHNTLNQITPTAYIELIMSKTQLRMHILF